LSRPQNASLIELFNRLEQDPWISSWIKWENERLAVDDVHVQRVTSVVARDMRRGAEVPDWALYMHMVLRIRNEGIMKTSCRVRGDRRFELVRLFGFVCAFGQNSTRRLQYLCLFGHWHRSSWRTNHMRCQPTQLCTLANLDPLETPTVSLRIWPQKHSG